LRYSITKTNNYASTRPRKFENPLAIELLRVTILYKQIHFLCTVGLYWEQGVLILSEKYQVGIPYRFYYTSCKTW